MKPANPGSRRQRIILYYAMAVALPGILLGYMAYRGIRNDQALREKESLRKLEANSQTFFSEIDSSLVKFMNEQTADPMFSDSRHADTSILIFFVKDINGLKTLITHHLLYLPSELLTVKQKQSGHAASMKEGQKLEFTERKFPEALKFYQDKVLRTTSKVEKMQALVASARLYNKMNQTDQAKSLYYEIRKNYQDGLLNGEIPTGLMASLEILKINHERGEKDEMRNNSRQYLELLLHPPVEYGNNQFDMFYQSFREIGQEQDKAIDSLITVIDTLRIKTDYLIKILKGTDLIQASGNNELKGNRNEVYVTPYNSPELSAVCLSWENSNGQQMGIIVDFPAYMKSVSEKLIQKTDPDSSISLKIEDNDGKIVFSRIINEGAIYLSFPFPDNLPKWKLLLSEYRPGFFPSLFRAGSGIYLLIFILIILFMILGFAFTIYTLNVELRLNKLKSEFISNVSHELKSPLTSIRMMTEMLHNNRVKTDERKSAYYSAMLEESEHLSHLIDNILDFSRMDEDRKKYNFVDLDLNELIGKFIESIRERLAESGFDIRYNHPDQTPLIKADKDAILQVIYNLVDNAIKFSGTSREIDIDLVPKTDELQFCVKDYGIGIPAKDVEKIFDRFYRSEQPQLLGIRGSGIGLTIVKKITEAHNGHVTIESCPGKGSLFCVHLPLQGS